MPLAAILCATAPSSDRPELLRGQIIFAAQTLIEYQARQATGVGARELFIMVESVTPQLSRMVDRLISDSIEIHLVRDMATLVRQLPRDGDVLLFADGMVVDQSHIRKLAAVEGNALLVVEDGSATDHLERVDGQYRWGGVARISPQTLFDTLDLIGDWDLMLTLVRAGIQNGAHRILIPQSDVTEGRVALIDRQDVADLVSKALTMPTEIDDMKAGAEYYILSPVARMIAPRLLRLQIPPGHLILAACASAAAGLGVLLLSWVIPALLLFLLALILTLIADHIAAMGRMVGRSDLLRLVPSGLALMGVAWIGMAENMRSDGLYLALLGAVTAVYLFRGKRFFLPQWAYVTPGSIMILLLAGAMTGLLPTVLVLGTILAIASLAGQLLLRDRSESEK